MGRLAFSVVVCGLAAGLVPSADDARLVYADFELPMDQRPVSSRGGWVQAFTYQENDTKPPRFSGMPGAEPAAPRVVRTSKEHENRAAAFEYELQAPNQWAGVGLEIYGRPDQDGVPVPDDVSGYKNLMLQVYTADVVHMRVELLSRETHTRSENYGKRAEQTIVPLQFTWRTKPGFNTYKVPLKDVMQPRWADVRLNPKKVFEKLTSVNVAVYCEDCRPEKGTIVIDNVTFEK